MNVHRSSRLAAGLLMLASSACQTNKAAGAPKHAAWVDENLIELPSRLRDFDFGTGSNLGLISETGVFESLNAGQAGELRDRGIAVSNRQLIAFGANGLVAVRDRGKFLVHRRDESATELQGATSTPGLMIFDDTSSRLAAIWDDGSVSVFSLDTGSITNKIVPDPETAAESEDPTRVVRTDGFRALRLTGARSIQILDLDDPNRSKVLDISFDGRVSPSLSRDGSKIAFLNGEGEVEIRSTSDDSVQTRLASPKAPVTALALSPDASVVAVVTASAVELWDTASNLRLDGFESRTGGQAGLRFSRDGLVLAWALESRDQIQIWKPLGAIVSFATEKPLVDERARSLCRDLAGLIRFRRASELFERASAHIKGSELQQARALLDEARSTFSDYPGIKTAYREIEGRRRAIDEATKIERQVSELEREGDYKASLALLEDYLANISIYGDFGLKKRADKLRAVLKLLEAVKENLQKDLEIDAVIAFEKAVALYPGLATRHPEYGQMRERLEKAGVEDGALAFQQMDWTTVVESYRALARLRPLTVVERMRLARSYDEVGDRDSARAVFESIEEDSESYVPARRHLASMARDDKDYRRALTELHRARAKAEPTGELEREHAELQELVGDQEQAIQAWRRVSELEPNNPQPLEAIARIESVRKNHEEAAKVLSKAIGVSSTPRTDLLLKIAESWQRCERNADALSTYTDLLDLLDKGTEAPELGDRPRSLILTKIRALGYVYRRGSWITRGRFLREQGWILHAGKWLRPEEDQLRRFATRFEKDRRNQKLRTLSDEEYAQKAAERRVILGMRRREVIGAWGYFNDQNTLRLADGVRYEQLLFGNSRRVYLRDGLLCSWSE